MIERVGGVNDADRLFEGSTRVCEYPDDDGGYRTMMKSQIVVAIIGFMNTEATYSVKKP